MMARDWACFLADEFAIYDDSFFAIYDESLHVFALFLPLLLFQVLIVMLGLAVSMPSVGY